MLTLNFIVNNDNKLSFIIIIYLVINTIITFCIPNVNTMQEPTY